MVHRGHRVRVPCLIVKRTRGRYRGSLYREWHVCFGAQLLQRIRSDFKQLRAAKPAELPCGREMWLKAQKAAISACIGILENRLKLAIPFPRGNDRTIREQRILDMNV